MSIEISAELLSRLIPLVKKACARAGENVIATSKYGRGGVPVPAGVPVVECEVRFLIASNDEHIKLVAYATERSPSPVALPDSAFDPAIVQIEQECNLKFSGATIGDSSSQNVHASYSDNGEVVCLDLLVALNTVSTTQLNFDRLTELLRLSLYAGFYTGQELSIDDVKQTITISGPNAENTSRVIDALRGARVIDHTPAPEACSPVANQFGLYLWSSLNAIIDREDLRVFSMKSDNVNKPVLGVYLPNAPELRQDFDEILQRIPAMYDEGKIRVKENN